MMRLRRVLPSSALGVRFRRNADPQSRRHRYNSLAIFISLMEPRPDAFGSCSWHYDFSTMPPVLRRLACPRPASRLVIGCIERLPLGQFYELGGLPRIASECFFIAICRAATARPPTSRSTFNLFPDRAVRMERGRHPPQLRQQSRAHHRCFCQSDCGLRRSVHRSGFARLGTASLPPGPAVLVPGGRR